MAEKEYDPGMHTAEHILNSVMNRRFGCGRSFRSHIEKKKSKCDYRLASGLTDEEILSVEASVNEIINMKIDISEEFITRADAEKNYFTGKLPPDAGDRIRIVRIGSYDACPCIGPHVKNTSEIGKFRIRTAGYDEGIFRIRYKLE